MIFRNTECFDILLFKSVICVYNKFEKRLNPKVFPNIIKLWLQNLRHPLHLNVGFDKTKQDNKITEDQR